jgi:hypothetical protein
MFSVKSFDTGLMALPRCPGAGHTQGRLKLACYLASSSAESVVLHVILPYKTSSSRGACGSPTKF